MKIASGLVLIIGISFFEVAIASRTYRAHEPKKPTYKACLVYCFGEKIRLYPMMQKDSKGDCIHKHTGSLPRKCYKGFKGIAAKEVLFESYTADVVSLGCVDQSCDDSASFNGFFRGD